MPHLDIYVRLNRPFPRRGTYEDEDGVQRPRTSGFIELVGGFDDLGAGAPFAVSRRRQCYATGWEAGRELTPVRDGQRVTVRVVVRPHGVVAESRVRVRQITAAQAASDKVEQKVLARLGCGRGSA